MSRPLLSVLTPSIPSRRDSLLELIDRMGRQIGNKPVEHLVLTDNKRRTIGAKRQALLEISRGQYVTFVDDDDWVADDYVDALLEAVSPEPTDEERHPDVVVFPVKVTINGGQEGIVEMSVRYAPRNGEALAEYRPPVTCRPPHELAVWRRELAIQSRFADTSQGEEFFWAARLWPLVKQEARIDKVLYWWRHDISRREHFEEAR